jgi:hypothetical protein
VAAFLDRLQARERVGAVDVHGAGAADALAAGAPERQRRVGLVLDLDQRVQDHRAAGVEIEFVGVDRRVMAVVRAPAIDLERTHALGTGRRFEGAAFLDLRIRRQ